MKSLAKGRDVLAFLLGCAVALIAVRIWDAPDASEAEVQSGIRPDAVEGAFEGDRSRFVDHLDLAASGGQEGRGSRNDASPPPGAAEGDATGSSDALVEAIISGPPMKIPTDEVLESRFGDLDLQQLEGAKMGIGWVLGQESEMILRRKLDSGQYRVDILPAGAEIEEAGSFPDGAPRSTGTRWVPLEDGQFEVRTSEVHPSESFTLQVRHAELSWLKRRIAKLKKEAKESTGGG